MEPLRSALWDSIGAARGSRGLEAVRSLANIWPSWGAVLAVLPKGKELRIMPGTA